VIPARANIFATATGLAYLSALDDTQVSNLVRAAQLLAAQRLGFAGPVVIVPLGSFNAISAKTRASPGVHNRGIRLCLRRMSNWSAEQKRSKIFWYLC
jgi:hypothetical protein